MEKSKKCRLLVIIPNYGLGKETLENRKKNLEDMAIGAVEVTVEDICGGPESIESEYDEVMAGKYILDRIRTVSKEEFDAIIVYCANDPVINAAREISELPVVGPGYSSIMIAQDLAESYSFVTVLDSMIPLVRRKIYGFKFDNNRCVSVRSIGVGVAELDDNKEGLYEHILEVCRKCKDGDDAHAIVLGCLGMAGLGRKISEEIGIPVLDPAEVSVRYAELLVHSGLRHSKKSY